MSDRKARLEIEELRVIEKKVFGRRHGKADFYRYLEAVLKLYTVWKVAGKVKQRIKRLARLYKDEIKLRKNTHPMRAIIDASSRQNPQVKSRWTRALEYAAKNGAQVNKAGFKQFLKDNGGPAGCATKIARPKAAKGKVLLNWGRRLGSSERLSRG